MLSAEDKARIRAEEIFRDETRRSLERPQTRRQKIFRFLNSPLGVWVLSTILVGTVGFIWGRWESAADRRQEQAREIRGLDAEVAVRLHRLAGDLARFAAEDGGTDGIKDTIERPPARWADRNGSLIPEHRESNLLALFWRLEQLADDEGSAEIRKARSCLVRITQQDLPAIGDTEAPEAYFQRREDFAEQVGDILTTCAWLKRWGGSAD